MSTDFATYLFQFGIDVARARAANHIPDHATTAVVTTTVLTPDGVRVACGEANYPRCEADVFEAGTLTITAIDDERIMREYPAGQWVGCTVYGSDGQINYHLRPEGRSHEV